MSAQDISSLIDWNSPTVEYNNCKPLIPLPRFDGQPVIDGNNPFDDLEKQVDQNEPFDMILNQSLNSSSEQIDLDKDIEVNNVKLSHDVPESNEVNSVTRMLDVFDKLNLHLDESVRDSSSKNELRYSSDVSNVMDVSPIESDVSEVQILRKRLSTILDKFSKPSEGVSEIAVGNPMVTSMPSSSEISCYSLKMSLDENDANEVMNSSGLINKAFIGKNSTNDAAFDSLMFNVNQLYEDLSCVSPAWDELVLYSSSSDEEPGNSPVKSIPAKNSSRWKNKSSAEKMIKKSCPRLPLGSKDPNIRAKRTATVVKEAGPLKAVIPIENMAKNVNQKLVETPKNSRFSRKLKPDSTSLKLKRRSVPIATSTPVGSLSPSLMNKSKIASQSKPTTPTTNASKSSKLSTPSVNSSKSCPPSPDSTSARFISKSVNSKVCSRRLALNAVSSSSSFNYLPSYRRSSKDVKYSSTNSSYKSMATGVKSCVKNKENLIPFRF